MGVDKKREGGWEVNNIVIFKAFVFSKLLGGFSPLSGAVLAKIQRIFPSKLFWRVIPVIRNVLLCTFEDRWQESCESGIFWLKNNRWIIRVATLDSGIIEPGFENSAFAKMEWNQVGNIGWQSSNCHGRNWIQARRRG